MKAYLLSLAVGLLVGAIYGFLNVRSPAPPVIALVGLFGILLGEQLAPLARHVVAGEQITLPWVKAKCGEHIFGALPGTPKAEPPEAAAPARDA